MSYNDRGSSNFGRSNNNFRGGRNNFRRGGRGGGGRNFRKPAARINHDMYIAKAEEPVAEEMPTSLYSDMPLESALLRNIAKKGYVNPTQIQEVAIPSILEGKDLVGIASTGSGKTAAFLIPMINKILKDRSQTLLIIVPTRELGQQIQDECFGLAVGTGIYNTLIIGGKSISQQINNLRRNPHIIIGTPGRLKDLAERRALRLDKVNNIVLDEVDRMLDMGFIRDIKELISQLSNDKQSLFFSATMTREAKEIADSLSKNPVQVQLKTRATSKNVDQNIVKVLPHQNKIEILHDILANAEVEKVLIFLRTKRATDRLYYELKDRGFKVESIHGDKTQGNRNRAIDNFRRSRANILVATDVVARGIDIPDVTHVINYEEPENYDDYVHRIGRTGRNGAKGVALTFVNGR
jgi:ATP-dependent RNA helicase RhlE